MNSLSLIFHAPIAATWIIAGTTVLCAFFIWKEYQRRMAYPLLRMVAVLVLWISLTGLVLQPGWTHQVVNEDILLTRGYLRSSVDSLIKARPGARIFRTPDAAEYRPTDQVVSPNEISSGNIHYLAVVGTGFPQNLLAQVDTAGYYFIPAPIPDGIIDLSLPEYIVPGRVSTIMGTLHTKVPTTIALSGPGGREDSVVLSQGGSFSLRITPRAPGRYLYRLQTTAANGAKEEIIPVVVQSPRVLRLLILQQFPTAEIRYLKNLLSQQGHQLTIRYQVSRSNFRYEFANQTGKRFDRLNRDLLNATDLVIGSPETVNAMSRGELDDLQEAIRNGLGILFLVNEVPQKKETLQRLLPMSFQTDKSDTMHLSGAVYSIATARPGADPNLVALIQNGRRIASGYTFLGAGKSGFQLLQETYRFMLRGETERYASLWVPLIEETSRRFAATQIHVRQRFPQVAGKIMDIDLITSHADPSLYADGLPIPMQEDVLIDDVWHAQVRLDQPGWHQYLSLPDSGRQDIYLHTPDAWKGVHDVRQMHANLWKTRPGSMGGTHLEETPVSPLVLFLCLMVAAGLLWLAPKL
ncbi:MAG TPA: hypothetical protein PLX35_16720 [Cyclobacteriaceae bacterium]|nr:hypothetical protein [Cyclobacteriaceae bacterium]